MSESKDLLFGQGVELAGELRAEEQFLTSFSFQNTSDGAVIFGFHGGLDVNEFHMAILYRDSRMTVYLLQRLCASSTSMSSVMSSVMSKLSCERRVWRWECASRAELAAGTRR